MTQDSNSGAYIPWGDPERAAPVAWWRGLVTIPVFLAHVTVMLTAVSGLIVLNFLVNPGTWWSLAFLVLWFAVVVIHALGLVSINLLIEEDSDAEVTLPSVQAEPNGSSSGFPPNGGTPGREPGSRQPPDSWQRETEQQGQAWPEPAAAAEANDGEDTVVDTRPGEPNGQSERIPWRAATDIAWLRRSNGADGNRDQRNSNSRDRDAPS